MDAIQAGVSVMLFSDNVPVEQEITLKDEAARHDVLVMGPTVELPWWVGSALGSPTRSVPARSA